MRKKGTWRGRVFTELSELFTSSSFAGWALLLL